MLRIRDSQNHYDHSLTGLACATSLGHKLAEAGVCYSPGPMIGVLTTGSRLFEPSTIYGDRVAAADLIEVSLARPLKCVTSAFNG